MGRRISKEFLHPSILEGVNNKIGNLDSLETDAKGNMVQAINELVEKLDNSAEIESGKELIANAVGEPLTAEESFEELSNDINGLLSTFKTNMMNNGVTVESSDKFKTLIDKIATMVEEGEGKGIQFASGTCGVSTGQYIKVTDLGFTPSIIIVSRVFTDPLTNTAGHFSLYCPLVTGNPNKYIVGQTASDSLGASEPMNLDGSDMSKSYISGDSFQIGTLSSSTSYQYNWLAIGIGEEDTTLRDSLASILENKGVDVTEEDNMASLITKVDGLKICYMGPGTEVLFYQASDLTIQAKTGTYTRNITIPEYPLNFAGMTLSFTHSSNWSWTSNGYDFSVVHERNNEALNTIDTFSSQESKDATKSYNLSVDDDYRVGDVIKITMVNKHGSESILEYIKLTFSIL